MKYSDLSNLKDIYLDQIFETRDNHLRLLFSRSKTNRVAETMTIGNIEINESYSIDIDVTLPQIQMDFEWYIGYSIRNESYTVWDDYEQFDGKIFRIYSKSRYLDFIKTSTIATGDYPGPYKHYGISCLNHIIDIVSTSDPIITEVARGLF
ncbi:hypothetical protein B4V02_07735 [Paenibacillus kribbensis]|uniref:Uncharacterized protein n=1 Tax=Paenibacillus kribbensis TaxID=172713 RepID=A0A222WL93_9BACL|nr:hypothetical protein [Paenibacillus kribbensis]ASR46573.1 hypothetical protein B4V02_07735 [Paenibacillus kribbensis]